jgi:glycosyltransferase involved in cell wall biosynthesis
VQGDARLRFVLVGGGDLESEVDDAIRRAEGARVVRLPFRDDVPELILGADVGCLVSAYEGLPVFFIECLQGGRPFLGTDAGDLGTAIRETGAGLVVDRPGDIDAIAAAARRLADDDLRHDFGVRAARAADGFSVATCAARYAEVFRGGPFRLRAP